MKGVKEMYNAISKSIIIATVLMMTACGSKSTTDSDAAMDLLNQAETAINEKDFSQAELLLDSINNAYPKQTDIRRKALELRPVLEEGMVIKQLESNDSLIAQLQIQYDSIKTQFDYIDNPQLVEGYYIAKLANDPTFLDKTGIQARVSKDGEFYMVSVLVGRPLNHNKISLTTNDGANAESAVIQYNDETNFHYGNTEMITFSHEQCDSIGKLAAQSPGTTMKVTFHGDKGTYSTALSKAQCDALRETYQYAEVINNIREATLKKEYLNRRLQLARDQQAKNLPTPEE